MNDPDAFASYEIIKNSDIDDTFIVDAKIK
jgi:hypothetical protein